MRKELLDKAGGFEAFGCYLAEDFFFAKCITVRQSHDLVNRWKSEKPQIYKIGRKKCKQACQVYHNLLDFATEIFALFTLLPLKTIFFNY